MGRRVLRDTVPVPSLSIFPVGNMQRKDISGLSVQIFTGPECATCIPPCSHRKPLPSYLLHAIFSLWQPSRPYRQHKLEDAAGRNGLSPISTPGREAEGLHAQLTLALSAPYAAIWFC